MSDETGFNYSLGVLIVLLIVFWSMCKCIGNGNQYQQYYNKSNRCEPFDGGSRMFYGNTPVSLSDHPIPYIRLNSDGSMAVPNSKSAYRHLSDFDEYNNIANNNLDSAIDNDPSTMVLKKKKYANQKKIPNSMTSQRKLQDSDRINRTPMSSY